MYSSKVGSEHGLHARTYKERFPNCAHPAPQSAGPENPWQHWGQSKARNQFNHVKLRPRFCHDGGFFKEECPMMGQEVWPATTLRKFEEHHYASYTCPRAQEVKEHCKVLRHCWNPQDMSLGFEESKCSIFRVRLNSRNGILISK